MILAFMVLCAVVTFVALLIALAGITDTEKSFGLCYGVGLVFGLGGLALFVQTLVDAMSAWESVVGSCSLMALTGIAALGLTRRDIVADHRGRRPPRFATMHRRVW